MRIKNILVGSILTLGGIAIVSAYYNSRDKKTLDEIKNTVSRYKSEKNIPAENEFEQFFSKNSEPEELQIETEKKASHPQKKEGLIGWILRIIDRIFNIDSTDNDTYQEYSQHNDYDYPKEEETIDEQSYIDELFQEMPSIGLLISRTDFVLNNKDYRDNRKYNCVALFNNWKKSLNMTECNSLNAAYDAIAERANIMPEQINENSAEEFLILWMKFIKELGVDKFKDESLDKNGNIVVTTANRGYYENGREFPDGTVCTVEETPWTFNGKVYFRGTLEPTEISSDPKPQLSDETINQSIEQTIAEDEQLS